MDISRVDRVATGVDALASPEGEISPHPAPQKSLINQAPTPAPAGVKDPAAGTAAAEGEGAAEAPALPTPSQIEALVAKINEKLQSKNHQARFEIDKTTKQVIFRLVDAESGEVLRQVPPQELLNMAAQMSKNAEAHFVETTI